MEDGSVCSDKRRDVRDLPVVDAHAHYWRAPEQIPVALSPADRPVSPDRLVDLMDDAGVTMLLQVTRVFDPDDCYSIAGARRYPDRFRVIGRFARGGGDVAAALRRWRCQPYVVGMRIFDDPPDQSLTSPESDEFWKTLAELDTPVSIYAPGHPEMIAQLATRWPIITFVLDHAGTFVYERVPPEHRFDGWPDVLRLAKFPNVLVKASALPEATHEEFPYPRAQRVLRQLCDVFGPHRVMWGSNFTPSAKVGTYRQQVEFARLAVEPMSTADQAQVLAGTAVRVFRLPEPTPVPPRPSA